MATAWNIHGRSFSPRPHRLLGSAARRGRSDELTWTTNMHITRLCFVSYLTPPDHHALSFETPIQNHKASD